jgi:hypothetical protein
MKCAPLRGPRISLSKVFPVARDSQMMHASPELSGTLIPTFTCHNDNLGTQQSQL